MVVPTPQHFKEKEAESSFEMVLRFLSGLTKFHNYPQQDLALILEPQDRYGQSGLNFHWLFEAQNVEYISSAHTCTGESAQVCRERERRSH